MPQIIYLVSCVDKKLEHAAPASELYTSQWFFKARGYPRRPGSPYHARLADMRQGLRARSRVLGDDGPQADLAGRKPTSQYLC